MGAQIWAGKGTATSQPAHAALSASQPAHAALSCFVAMWQRYIYRVILGYEEANGLTIRP